MEKKELVIQKTLYLKAYSFSLFYTKNHDNLTSIAFCLMDL